MSKQFRTSQLGGQRTRTGLIDIWIKLRVVYCCGYGSVDDVIIWEDMYEGQIGTDAKIKVYTPESFPLRAWDWMSLLSSSYWWKPKLSPGVSWFCLNLRFLSTWDSSEGLVVISSGGSVIFDNKITSDWWFIGVRWGGNFGGRARAVTRNDWAFCFCFNLVFHSFRSSVSKWLDNNMLQWSYVYVVW